MRHKWNNTDKCERCGLVREHRTVKTPLPDTMGTMVQHYTVYYVNGYRVEGKPACFYPGQLKFDFGFKEPETIFPIFL